MKMMQGYSVEQIQMQKAQIDEISRNAAEGFKQVSDAVQSRDADMEAMKQWAAKMEEAQAKTETWLEQNLQENRDREEMVRLAQQALEQVVQRQNATEQSAQEFSAQATAYLEQAAAQLKTRYDELVSQLVTQAGTRQLEELDGIRVQSASVAQALARIVEVLQGRELPWAEVTKLMEDLGRKQSSQLELVGRVLEQQEQRLREREHQGQKTLERLERDLQVLLENEQRIAGQNQQQLLDLEGQRGARQSELLKAMSLLAENVSKGLSTYVVMAEKQHELIANRLESRKIEVTLPSALGERLGSLERAIEKLGRPKLSLEVPACVRQEAEARFKALVETLAQLKERPTQLEVTAKFPDNWDAGFDKLSSAIRDSAGSAQEREDLKRRVDELEQKVNGRKPSPPVKDKGKWKQPEIYFPHPYKDIGRIIQAASNGGGQGKGKRMPEEHNNPPANPPPPSSGGPHGNDENPLRSPGDHRKWTKDTLLLGASVFMTVVELRRQMAEDFFNIQVPKYMDGTPYRGPREWLAHYDQEQRLYLKGLVEALYPNGGSSIPDTELARKKWKSCPTVYAYICPFCFHK